MKFKLKKTLKNSLARTGTIYTQHGKINTPVFMPVGTKGTVKTMSAEELEEIGAEIILGNNYHLYIQPGLDVIEAMGGLHNFIKWNQPILTDSGGFQIFSLSPITKITDEGAKFQSYLDGSRIFFTPKIAIKSQQIIGADIIMALDECTSYPISHKKALEAVIRTTKWAKEGAAYFYNHNYKNQALFGIIQGSVYPDLRKKSLRELTNLPFDGFAVGGLSVGEPLDLMLNILKDVTPHLPIEKPHYFMGLGTPIEIINSIHLGIDMFDCVMPTRVARNGLLFTSRGRIQIRNNKFRLDDNPIDANCKCKVCQTHSRAYIRHLIKNKEILGMRLATYHNLYFLIDFVKQIRKSITQNYFLEFRDSVLKLKL